LIERDPAAWLAWVGLPVDGPVAAIDSELSTVLAEVDKVLRVEAPAPYLAHFEIQASNDPRLPYRLLQYHALLLHRHELPVESAVVLLRPLADGPEMSGRFEQHGVAGNLTISFSFRVIRVWERPVEEFLDGGLGVLPLAPLADVVAAQLPDIMRHVDERFRGEAEPGDAEDLRAATVLLLRLRYSAEQIRSLGTEMAWWRESPLFLETLEEGREQGRVEEARRLVLDLGTDKFGAPEPSLVSTVETIGDPDVLERLVRRILRATSWQELLAPEG